MNQLSTHIETLIDNYNSCTSTFIFHTWAFLNYDEQVLFYYLITGPIGYKGDKGDTGLIGYTGYKGDKGKKNYSTLIQSNKQT